MRDVPRENCPGARCCERFGKAHLKTVSERPLIGHGGSRYEQTSGSQNFVAATRVEPRFMVFCSGMETSLAIEILHGTFLGKGEDG